MTLYDLMAILILVISGAIGLLRGAARELVTVAAFILAVVIAVVGLRISGPIARHAIHVHFLANAVAILVVFVIGYGVLRAVGHLVIRRFAGGKAAGGPDRAVGAGFGILRGWVFLGVLFLVFNAATPPERVPHWIKDAALYPLSGTAGHVLMALAPEGSAVAHKVVGSATSDRSSGYDAASRKGVDDLVEKTR